MLTVATDVIGRAYTEAQTVGIGERQTLFDIHRDYTRSAGGQIQGVGLGGQYRVTFDVKDFGHGSDARGRISVVGDIGEEFGTVAAADELRHDSLDYHRLDGGDGLLERSGAHILGPCRGREMPCRGRGRDVHRDVGVSVGIGGQCRQPQRVKHVILAEFNLRQDTWLRSLGCAAVSSVRDDNVLFEGEAAVRLSLGSARHRNVFFFIFGVFFSDVGLAIGLVHSAVTTGEQARFAVYPFGQVKCEDVAQYRVYGSTESEHSVIRHIDVQVTIVTETCPGRTQGIHLIERQDARVVHIQGQGGTDTASVGIDRAQTPLLFDSGGDAIAEGLGDNAHLLLLGLGAQGHRFLAVISAAYADEGYFARGVVTEDFVEVDAMPSSLELTCNRYAFLGGEEYVDVLRAIYA